MDETRATAALPHLDVAIVHRALPEEGAEAISITLRATPSFDAAFTALAPMLAAPMLMAAAHPAGPWAAPMLAWAGMMQRAWTPWLALMAPPQRPGEK
ncbi:hypothetical protein [Azospirillum halopraeferens]|uniref:hypothetical protein n=1 Tax=Azospirillum halopraeferens TaxID=34010 RepID=UPI00041FFC66|nr:hypothetical protein [Azospirillum halopraeferens]